MERGRKDGEGRGKPMECLRGVPRGEWLGREGKGL